MEIEISRTQQAFISATADEVLFGGAAGGGKSHGQLVDAFLYALKYPRSKQLILRRTFAELEKSLIRVSLELYPQKVYRFNGAKHSGHFPNGSIIDFGYCFHEKDVHRYQSSEYDVIRFDELTHFTEYVYTYLMSRLRGANDYPKQVKSSTNPGGVGHSWVKARFIDVAAPGKLVETGTGSRVFIPSLLKDNLFLNAKDPGYAKRLENLPERERKALRDGDWNVFEGQFFAEFSRGVHVCGAFPIPRHWKVYRVLDYGLDMLCCLWVAVDEQKRAYVYKELYEPGLIISEAARRILEVNGPDVVYATLAPPDLWARRQETGKTAYDIFCQNGVPLVKTSNNRVAGWLAVKEWLRPHEDEAGADHYGRQPGAAGVEPMPGEREAQPMREPQCGMGKGSATADLRIFENCLNLIRTLPAVQADEKNPNDVATEPHELTHAPDALRGFCVYWTSASAPAPAGPEPDAPAVYEVQVDDFVNFGI